MATARVDFPLDEITTNLRRMSGRLAQDRQNLLNAVGVQMLSLSQQAYRQKARGGMGSDGIQWGRLQRSTLEARVRRRAPARRIVQQRKKLAEQIKATLKSKGGNRASKDAQVKKKRQQRKELSAKLKTLVDAEQSKYEVGVDTGLQRASASPGFVANDGRGGNLLRVDASTVTVGYNRSYSEHFDAKRKLLPDELPAEWQRRIDGQVERWADRIARETIGE